MRIWFKVSVVLLQLTQMSQEFVEQLVWSLVKNCALYLRNLFRKPKQSKENEQITKEENNEEEKRDAVEEIENLDNEEVQKETENVESREDKSEENETIEENETTDDETETVENVSTDKEESSKEVPDVEKKRKESVSLDTAIFFHFTLFLIWCLVAALCIPSVLTWAHNFR